MIRVQGPDGLIVEFPEGTPPDVMKAAMQRKFGAPQAHSKKDQSRIEVETAIDSGFNATGYEAENAATSNLARKENLGGEPYKREFSTYSPTVQGMTLGGADEFAAGVFGSLDALRSRVTGNGPRDFSEAIQQHRARQARDAALYREENPVSDVVGTVAGGFLFGPAGMGPAASGGANLVSGAGKAGAVAAPSLWRTAGKSAAVAGGIGTTQGFLGTEGDVDERLRGAAIGGASGVVAGATAPYAARGMGKLARTLRTPVDTAPSVADLQRMSREGYQAAEQAGITLTPEAWATTLNDLKALAAQRGLGGELSEATDDLYAGSRKLISALEKTRGRTPSLQDVEMAKRVAADLASSPTADGSVAKGVSGKLRGLVDDLTPDQIESGDAAAGVAGIQQGRQNWQAFKKAEQIEEAFRVAGIKGKTNYTQAGDVQALRREFSKIAQDPDFEKIWTPDEQAQILKVIDGGNVEGALRWAGKFSPNGAVTGAFNVGLALAVPPWISIPMTGGAMLSRAAADRLTKNQAKVVDILVRHGGDMQKVTAAINASPNRERLVNALLAMTAGRSGGAIGNEAASSARP